MRRLKSTLLLTFLLATIARAEIYPPSTYYQILETYAVGGMAAVQRLVEKHPEYLTDKSEPMKFRLIDFAARYDDVLMVNILLGVGDQLNGDGQLSLAQSCGSTKVLTKLKPARPGAKNLEDLSVQQTRVDDEARGYVRNLVALTSLNVAHTDITEKCLRDLSSLHSLDSLDLEGIELSPNSISDFQGLKRLRKLILTDSPKNRIILEELQKALPDCKISLIKGTEQDALEVKSSSATQGPTTKKAE